MNLMKKCIAECIGTAVLVMVACGVAVVAQTFSWWVATSLAFGLVIVAMAYSIGNVSGCHINPAVSLAKAIRHEITWKECAMYMASQFVGALVGATLLGLCLRGNFESLGGNEIQELLLNDAGKTDAWSYVCAFLVETLLTFIFVIAVLGATDKRHHEGKHAGIVIGLALVLVHLFGLAFTGTSVNPARSFGPAVVQAIAGSTTSITQIWIWILAPLLGGALAAVIYSYLTHSNEE
ncbi:MAG: aquaporin [Anaeroplasmataceae bacterium]|nr:aquaporin [Anaeroplasmataceae bacterium]